MLPVTGYADRWSVKPGESLRFMVSVAGGGTYQARVARILCGDPNPRGPGYREVPMPCAIEGTHAGIDQPIRLGSSVDVPRLDLGQGGTLRLSATVWPTLLARGAQALIAVATANGTLTLGIGPDGAWTTCGDARAGTACTLTERRWYDIAVSLADGRLTVEQAPHAPRLDRAEAAAAAAHCAVAMHGTARITLAAASGGDALHLDGKLERPRIARDDATVAEWDFSRDMTTQTVIDTGPQAAHGTLKNLPTRAMIGCLWDGSVFDWRQNPAHYAAIHFHSDDLSDAEWAESLVLTVPDDWPSGLYALHLRTPAGRDNIPFFVRAKKPGSQARIAWLAPTVTYSVYANFQRVDRQATNAARAEQWGALPHQPDGHPEYGLSTYNHHADGSGATIGTTRRPMLDKRIAQFVAPDESDGGSGAFWIVADSYLLDLFDRAGEAIEVITDHDLIAEGKGLLDAYGCVITGQHPEYYTQGMLDDLRSWLNAGGRFIYLGGNGFYWKTVAHPDGPWAFEVRRAESGIRTWATQPGENHHAFDGTMGGLWRRLGRPPQALVGIGFSTQGVYTGHPYTFRETIEDPRVAFLRAGIEAACQPGKLFGERGFMGGGAAGFELDRTDPLLGTPPHALVVADAVVHHPGYQPVNEERLGAAWPGTVEQVIRADLTFFETPGGGAVLSVGSMQFIGALPVDGGENVCGRMILNAARRFADPAGFGPALPVPPGIQPA